MPLLSGFEKIAKLLIENGANVNAIGLPDMNTPLILTARKGRKRTHFKRLQSTLSIKFFFVYLFVDRIRTYCRDAH